MLPFLAMGRTDRSPKMAIENLISPSSRDARTATMTTMMRVPETPVAVGSWMWSQSPLSGQSVYDSRAENGHSGGVSCAMINQGCKPLSSVPIVSGGGTSFHGASGMGGRGGEDIVSRGVLPLAHAHLPVPSWMGGLKWLQSPSKKGGAQMKRIGDGSIDSLPGEYGRDEDGTDGSGRIGRWTEEEHGRFLEGLRVCGKGKWKKIAEEFVVTRTRMQVASHAQKYFKELEK